MKAVYSCTNGLDYSQIKVIRIIVLRKNCTISHGDFFHSTAVTGEWQLH